MHFWKTSNLKRSHVRYVLQTTKSETKTWRNWETSKERKEENNTAWASFCIFFLSTWANESYTVQDTKSLWKKEKVTKELQDWLNLIENCQSTKLKNCQHGRERGDKRDDVFYGWSIDTFLITIYSLSNDKSPPENTITGYSFWDQLRNFLHKSTWIVLSVHKLNKQGKFW